MIARRPLKSNSRRSDGRGKDANCRWNLIHNVRLAFRRFERSREDSLERVQARKSCTEVRWKERLSYKLGRAGKKSLGGRDRKRGCEKEEVMRRGDLEEHDAVAWAATSLGFSAAEENKHSKRVLKLARRIQK